MTEQAESKSFTPHIALIVIVVLLVALGFYLFTGDKEEPVVPPVEVMEPEPELPVVEEPVESEYATEDDTDMLEEMPAEPEPEPIDISDAAVKSKVISITDYEPIASLIVNDDLLRRFVVVTDNIARDTLAPNHQFVQPPEQDFRVYEQAGRTFIDAASYKRYTPYVEAFDAMETDALLSLYESYKPAIEKIYDEISDPDNQFTSSLADAIDHLLNTPEVPVPVEVYSDSVMFEFKDERLEALSGPQKQLLRTGPENMRRIKAKLRELREALQSNQ